MLDGTNGDAVVLGAATLEQLEQNLVAICAGRLDYQVEAAADDAWSLSGPATVPYFSS
jgi:hypothetical protein